jgi:hypothetical protein
MFGESRSAPATRFVLATSMVAVLTLFAAWATEYPPSADTSASRPGYAFVAAHAAGGPTPGLAPRGQHLTSGKVRARDALRHMILTTMGQATTRSILFRLVSRPAEWPRRSSFAAPPRVRAPPAAAEQQAVLPERTDVLTIACCLPDAPFVRPAPLGRTRRARQETDGRKSELPEGRHIYSLVAAKIPPAPDFDPFAGV